MTKEEDDLYADLYSEEVGGDKSGNPVADDSIYDEDVKPKGMLNKGTSNPSTSTAKSSFIPAAKPSSSSGSSFIPADPNKVSASDSGSNYNNDTYNQRNSLPSTMMNSAPPSSFVMVSI